MRLYLGRVWPLQELGPWASEQVPLSIWLFSLVTMWLLTSSSGSGFPHISVNPHHRGWGAWRNVLQKQILRPSCSHSAEQDRDPGVCVFTSTV